MMRFLYTISLMFLLYGCSDELSFSDKPIPYNVSYKISANENPLVANVNVYPNPFTNNVNIDLRVNHNSDVTMKVTNADGDSQVVMDDNFQSGRYYTVDLDFSKHDPGAYLLEVTINEYVDRMVLIKAE